MKMILSNLKINETDSARTTKLSPYVNMQGLSIDVEDVRLARIVLSLNVSPPEQIVHANKKLWQGLDHNFEFLRCLSQIRSIVITWVPH